MYLYASLCVGQVRWELLRSCSEDLTRVQSVSASDSALVRCCAQRLATEASDFARLPGSLLSASLLTELKASIDATEQQLKQLPVPTLHVSKLPPILTALEARAKFVPFPLFDRFRNEESVEVRHLTLLILHSLSCHLLCLMSEQVISCDM
jgi:hypothetical protein